jgi:KaiC/GvpD/RAD55 family RecA-like ATPase
MSHLALMAPESDDLTQLPAPHVLAGAQGLKALQRLKEDPSGFPRFHRWPSVVDITGAMAPDEMWLVGGRQGNGKSLFCQNVLDQLIAQNIPTLYIGTEQSPEVLKIKQACLHTGISPRNMLKPEPEYKATTAYKTAYEAVREEIGRLSKPPISELMFFANTDYVTRQELTKWVAGGVKRYGIQCVIIDHIDHMEHGDGINQRAEIDKTVAHVDLLLKQHHIPGLVASQIKRTGGDVLKKFSPPDAEDFAESSKKERVASVMLSLWRPLRTDMDAKDLRELQASAKQGTQPEEKIYHPNSMGVRCVKDRLGTVPGKQTFLSVGRGNLLTEDEASVHGIRTTSRTL